MTPNPGIMVDYHSVKALSKSAIDLLLDCPAYYKAWVEDAGDYSETKAFAFGSMSHTVLLEPYLFDKRYAVTDLNLTTKAGRAFKKEVACGRKIVKGPDYESALYMAMAVREHPQVKYLFENYVTEQAIYWTREDGVECKAKPDIISSVQGINYAADFKSTESVSPEAIKYTIEKYHYHRQAAWYLDGLNAVGRPCSDFVFIFVEKKYPHLITACHLGSPSIAQGRYECDRGVEILLDCKAKNSFPCFTKDILTIDLPARAFKEF